MAMTIYKERLKMNYIEELNAIENLITFVEKMLRSQYSVDDSEVREMAIKLIEKDI